LCTGATDEVSTTVWIAKDTYSRSAPISMSRPAATGDQHRGVREDPAAVMHLREPTSGQRPRRAISQTVRSAITRVNAARKLTTVFRVKTDHPRG
jgi:hypothetical protein